MKNKIFKISIVLVMIMTMTMTNFIFVGANLISYATDEISTNHKNVEFETYFKEGEEEALYLRVNVKKEGYFNFNAKLNSKKTAARGLSVRAPHLHLLITVRALFYRFRIWERSCPLRPA